MTAKSLQRQRTSVRRSAVRASRRTRRLLRISTFGVIVFALALAVNWIYQVVRKPSELLFPASAVLSKRPADTWRSYAALFERNSTRSIPPQLLAALAQREGAGNPLARTYWRWSVSLRPFDLYRPASSSVGMYQMTDAAYAEARGFCISNHRVVARDAGESAADCRSGQVYSRVLPGDAVELTAIYLDRQVAAVLRRAGLHASPRQRQHLAAAIHLCGPRAGEYYARRGFRFAPGARCADHDPAVYLLQVDRMESDFVDLARAQRRLHARTLPVDG